MANVRKAAVLLMSLPEEQAGQVLGKLTPKQVEAVSIEIAKLGNITGEEQESVINEFADASPSSLRRRQRRLGHRPRSSSNGRWARMPAARSTTSASRSKPCRSDSCKKSIAKTCSRSSSTSIRKRSP